MGITRRVFSKAKFRCKVERGTLAAWLQAQQCVQCPVARELEQYPHSALLSPGAQHCNARAIQERP